MAFTGKYEVESQENYDDFLKLIGIPDDVREKGRDFKIITEVIQDGKQFTWSQIYPQKTMTNKFIIDQESDMETMAGKKFKATVTMDGGKITAKFPNYLHTAEVQGDKLIEELLYLEMGNKEAQDWQQENGVDTKGQQTSTVSGAKGTVTMKRISKRI